MVESSHHTLFPPLWTGSTIPIGKFSTIRSGYFPLHLSQIHNIRSGRGHEGLIYCYSCSSCIVSVNVFVLDLPFSSCLWISLCIWNSFVSWIETARDMDDFLGKGCWRILRMAERETTSVTKWFTHFEVSLCNSCAEPERASNKSVL